MEFSAPITYSIAKNAVIPGSNVFFLGARNEGAQFSGLEGYPYRKAFDSMQYSGRVLPKVFLKLDLRVLSYTDSSAAVGGTANIKIEP